MKSSFQNHFLWITQQLDGKILRTKRRKKGNLNKYEILQIFFKICQKNCEYFLNSNNNIDITIKIYPRIINKINFQKPNLSWIMIYSVILIPDIPD